MPIQICSRNFENVWLKGSHFRNSTVLGLFAVNFHYIGLRFQIFGSLGGMERSPVFPDGSSFSVSHQSHL